MEQKCAAMRKANNGFVFQDFFGAGCEYSGENSIPTNL
jgi:hypothetical protein